MTGAVAAEGGKVWVIKRRRDPNYAGRWVIDRFTFAEWSKLYMNESVAKVVDGKIEYTPLPGWWLRHARNREPLLRDRYVGISGNKKRFDLATYAGAQHVLVAPHGRNPGRGRQRTAQDRHDTKSGGHRAGFCVGGSSGRHWIHDCYHAVKNRRALFQALSTQRLRVATAIVRA